MDETVSVRIPTELLQDLERLGHQTHQARSDILRDVLHRGIEARRLELALEAYRQQRASLGRASEIAGLPLPVFLEELRKAGLPLNYGVSDLADDLSWAKS